MCACKPHLWEILVPRQQLLSVAYSLKAQSVSVGAITADMLADEAVTGSKITAGAITADKISGGAGSGVDADLLDGFNASSFAPTVHNHDSQYYSKAYVDVLEARVATLETKLQYLTVVGGTVIDTPRRLI